LYTQCKASWLHVKHFRWTEQGVYATDDKTLEILQAVMLKQHRQNSERVIRPTSGWAPFH